MQETETSSSRRRLPRHLRLAVAGHVEKFEKKRDAGVSQREFALQHSMARTSLQHWLRRKAAIEADAAVVAFFESPVGTALLHRIVVAAHLVFSFIGAAGSRLVARFLRESGLGAFVATSTGSQHKLAAAIEAAVGNYGDAQREALAATMARKSITVCQDETFHPRPCLVAIEPVSNFLLVERYESKRDAATWNVRMSEAIQGMPVTIRQSTSDEAKGIIHHVQQGLGAQHSPDVFHVQHTMGGAIARRLAIAEKAAEAACEGAHAARERTRDDEAQWRARPRSRGRAPDFAARRAAADAHLRAAQARYADAQARRAVGRAALRGISEAYHPFDLTDGTPRTAEQVQVELDAHMETARAAVVDGNLPQAAMDGIEKAARVVPKMVATLAYFESACGAALDALRLAPQVRAIAAGKLLPSLYLAMAANKAGKAEHRRRIAGLARRMREDAYAAAPELVAPTLLAAMTTCCALFQRASSCVEGRNGQLALRHHSLHTISDARLEALTTVHNYVLTRADGTTAAERFFGRRPTCSLFEYLCDTVALPPRPAARRPRRVDPASAAA